MKGYEDRESDIMQARQNGLTRREIADRLDIPFGTVNRIIFKNINPKAYEEARERNIQKQKETSLKLAILRRRQYNKNRYDRLQENKYNPKFAEDDPVWKALPTDEECQELFANVIYQEARLFQRYKDAEAEWYIFHSDGFVLHAGIIGLDVNNFRQRLAEQAVVS